MCLSRVRTTRSGAIGHGGGDRTRDQSSRMGALPSELLHGRGLLNRMDRLLRQPFRRGLGETYVRSVEADSRDRKQLSGPGASRFVVDCVTSKRLRDSCETNRQFAIRRRGIPAARRAGQLSEKCRCRSAQPLHQQQMNLALLLEHEVDDLPGRVGAEQSVADGTVGIGCVLRLPRPRLDLEHSQHFRIVRQRFSRKGRDLLERFRVWDDSVQPQLACRRAINARMSSIEPAPRFAPARWICSALACNRK